MWRSWRSLCKLVLVFARYLLGDDFNSVVYLVSWVIYGRTSPYHGQPNQPRLFSLSAPTVSTFSKWIMLCKRLQWHVFRLLVISPGNTNLNNLNPPSEWAMDYIGFHCISVDKLSFFDTTFALECSFKFLFRAHAGFIVAQLKTLSISGGCQRKNNTLIRDGPFSSLGTAMYLVFFFSQKLFYHQKLRSGTLFFF